VAAAPTSVVYLLGPPGVGKRTVGAELARRTGAVLLDNNLVNRPVMSVMGWDGGSPLPTEVWTYTGRIREAVLDALEQIAPREVSYVLTNSLEQDDRSRALFARVRALAANRGATFAPVFLTCEREELLRRATSEDRRRERKLSGPAATADFIDAVRLLKPEVPELLELDVTTRTPVEVADTVVAHVELLRRGAAGAGPTPTS